MPTQAPTQRISEENRFRLAAPQDFVLGTPAEDRISAREAQRRYAAFCAALTGDMQTPSVSALFYADRSGEREDYWLLRNAAAGGVDLAVSAVTGRLLGLRGNLSCAALIPPSGRMPTDWRDAEYAHVVSTLETALCALSNADTAPQVSFNAMLDGEFLSFAAEYPEGYWAEISLRMRDGAALLHRMEAACQGEEDRRQAPWLADVRFVDPSSGAVIETWLGGRGVTDFFS